MQFKITQLKNDFLAQVRIERLIYKTLQSLFLLPNGGLPLPFPDGGFQVFLPLAVQSKPLPLM